MCRAAGFGRLVSLAAAALEGNLLIITNLIGGLGNQMFQYACGHALALDLGTSLRVSSELFGSYKLHNGLELEEQFLLNLKQASAAEMRNVLGRLRSHPSVRRVVARPALQALGGACFLAEPSLAYWPELYERAARHRRVYLHGYWQSERYFNRHSADIRAAFNWRKPLEGPNAELAREIAAAPCAVSMHVRRGDYVSSKKNQAIYAACSPEYYLAALQRLQTVSPQMQVFAFSDDPQWVRDVLAPQCPGLRLVDHNRGAASAIDMRLMSLCRHHVIANSSFSWWGAWLDARTDKIVIAPMRWFADGRSDVDLVPAEWERL
jgi:hypothetical protein